jgi:hypothetical protein
MTRLAILATLALAAGSTTVVSRAENPRAPGSDQPPLASPPRFSREVTDVFFTDARQALGPKPAAVVTPESARPTSSASPALGDGKHGWSQVVAAEVLEDEIKQLAVEVADETRSASTFKSTGQKRLRSTFSSLAVTFGVIGQFDGQVRWQAEAPGMRDLCARAARNLKAASDATLHEGRTRGEDLASLVRGQSVTVPEADAEASMSELVDRRGLMSRMETAERDRLRPWLANKGEFVEHREQIAHEAAILRLLAHVVRAEGFEYADDEAYVEHANDFGAHCRQLLEATEAGDYEKARAALTGVSQSCDRCHGDFRS